MDTKQRETKKKSTGLVLLFAILYAAFQAVSVVLGTLSLEFDLVWMVQSALMLIMCFALFFTYASHTKNLTKPLLGAALMLLLSYSLTQGCHYIQYIKVLIEFYGGDFLTTAYLILIILQFICVLGLNFMLYAINADRHSNPKKIQVNKVLYIAFMIIVGLECVYFIIAGIQGGYTFNEVLSYCLGTLADIFSLGIVIIIEKSMDEFRLDREEAGWTKETGYPEGYDHGYGKKPESK